MTKIFKPVSGLLIVYGVAVFVATFMGYGDFFVRSFYPAISPPFVYVLAVLSLAAGIGGLTVNNPRILKVLAWALLLVAYLVFFMSYGTPVGTILVDLAVLLLAIFYFKAVQKKNEVQSDRSGKV